MRKVLGAPDRRVAGATATASHASERRDLVPPLPRAFPVSFLHAAEPKNGMCSFGGPKVKMPRLKPAPVAVVRMLRPAMTGRFSVAHPSSRSTGH